MNIIEVPDKKSKIKNIYWLSDGTKVVNGRIYTPLSDFFAYLFDMIFYIILVLTILLLPATGILKLLTIQFPDADLVNAKGFALGYFIVGLIIYGSSILSKHYKKFINK